MIKKLIELIQAFLESMRMDLNKNNYKTKGEYQKYIYGSADVVGLMCLKVFVNGDTSKYHKLKPYAMSLGSAFQKVNFLRDLNADFENLERTYFPNLNVSSFDEKTKDKIINEIEKDFDNAVKGIFLLPESSRLGVYIAYRYYNKLLLKLKNTPQKNSISTNKGSKLPKNGVLAQSFKVSPKSHLMDSLLWFLALLISFVTMEFMAWFS